MGHLLITERISAVGMASYQAASAWAVTESQSWPPVYCPSLLEPESQHVVIRDSGGTGKPQHPRLENHFRKGPVFHLVILGMSRSLVRWQGGILGFLRLGCWWSNAWKWRNMQILVVGAEGPVLAHPCWCSLCELGQVNWISVTWCFSSCEMEGA